MSSQRDLAVTLVHELAAPLLALESRLRALMEEDGCRERLEPCLAEVLSLRALVSDVQLLRGIAIRSAPFPLSSVLEAVTRTFEPIAAARGVRLEIRLGTAEVLGDSRATARIVANLVDNALKFSPPKGTVRVAARDALGEVLVEVEDEGIGVPEDARERIFEPFVKLDRESAGSGLGLTLAKALAEAQGGKLEIQSASSPGSRFLLRLRKP